MTDLKSQKQMAAKILKCGKSRVWIDPSRIADVEDAITAQDIRKMIRDGIISEKPAKGNSGYRTKKNKMQKAKGRRRGRGSRRGQKSGQKKNSWITRIRAMRKLLREMKEAGKIDNAVYREMYTKTRSGFFRSKSHLLITLERQGVITQKDLKAESDEKKIKGEKKA